MAHAVLVDEPEGACPVEEDRPVWQRLDEPRTGKASTHPKRTEAPVRVAPVHEVDRTGLADQQCSRLVPSGHAHALSACDRAGLREDLLPRALHHALRDGPDPGLLLRPPDPARVRSAAHVDHRPAEAVQEEDAFGDWRSVSPHGAQLAVGDVVDVLHVPDVVRDAVKEAGLAQGAVREPGEVVRAQQDAGDRAHGPRHDVAQPHLAAQGLSRDLPVHDPGDLQFRRGTRSNRRHRGVGAALVLPHLPVGPEPTVHSRPLDQPEQPRPVVGDRPHATRHAEAALVGLALLVPLRTLHTQGGRAAGVAKRTNPNAVPDP